MKNPVYIVSGLPRSGTSMLMQVLMAGGMSVATDGKRKPDESNPRGYLEVESIIDRLRDNPEFIFNFEGKVVKVVAYGLQYLPPGRYRIIYVDRNIDEVLDSMEKMMNAGDEEREETRRAFLKLNEKSKADLRRRDDVEALFVSYNDILAEPRRHLVEVHQFLKEMNLNFDKMVKAVNWKLYRQKKMEG